MRDVAILRAIDLRNSERDCLWPVCEEQRRVGLRNINENAKIGGRIADETKDGRKHAAE